MVHKAHPCQTGLKHLSTHACKYKDTKKDRPSPPYNLLTPDIYIAFLFVHLSIAYLP